MILKKRAWTIKRDDSYKSKFRILDNYPSVIDEEGTKEIRLATSIKNETGHILYEGHIRVKFNEFGIFPSIQDVAEAVSNSTLRRLLMSELKRYIKPHRKFLTRQLVIEFPIVSFYFFNSLRHHIYFVFFLFFFLKLSP